MEKSEKSAGHISHSVTSLPYRRPFYIYTFSANTGTQFPCSAHSTRGDSGLLDHEFTAIVHILLEGGGGTFVMNEDLIDEACTGERTYPGTLGTRG